MTARFGRSGWAMAALALGVIGLSATAALAYAGDSRQVAASYLTAFAEVCGISVASLLLLAIFHASGATWMTAIRRPIEGATAVCFLCALLFVPLLLFAGHFFPWVTPSGPLSAEQLEQLTHRRETWLNVPFWGKRAAVYFAIWTGFGLALRHASFGADAAGAPAGRLLARQRALGAASIPFVGLAMTFAAFDWLMSLQPLWYSTIFGVYWFAGSFGAAIAVLTLAVTLPPGRALFGPSINEEHLHNLGSLLFAFTAFWAYIAFSQLLLIWIADLSTEVPFYLLRGQGGWLWVSIALMAGHFLVPFFALLPRAPKRRPGYLAFWAVWILAFNHLDSYWLVMPVLHPQSAMPHLADLTTVAGVGGVSVAFAIFSLKGKHVVPVGDPTLPDSIHYVKA